MTIDGAHLLLAALGLFAGGVAWMVGASIRLGRLEGRITAKIDALSVQVTEGREVHADHSKEIATIGQRVSSIEGRLSLRGAE